jgi:hypothetical protein
MSNSVEIVLDADTREDLAAAIARLQGAGLTIRWAAPPFARPSDPAWATRAKGTLILYDTPETVEAKATIASEVVRAAIRNLERP